MNPWQESDRCGQFVDRAFGEWIAFWGPFWRLSGSSAPLVQFPALQFNLLQFQARQRGVRPLIVPAMQR